MALDVDTDSIRGNSLRQTEGETDGELWREERSVIHLSEGLPLERGSMSSQFNKGPSYGLSAEVRNRVR